MPPVSKLLVCFRETAQRGCPKKPQIRLQHQEGPVKRISACASVWVPVSQPPCPTLTGSQAPPLCMHNFPSFPLLERGNQGKRMKGSSGGHETQGPRPSSADALPMPYQRQVRRWHKNTMSTSALRSKATSDPKLPALQRDPSSSGTRGDLSTGPNPGNPDFGSFQARGDPLQSWRASVDDRQQENDGLATWHVSHPR